MLYWKADCLVSVAVGVPDLDNPVGLDQPVDMVDREIELG